MKTAEQKNTCLSSETLPDPQFTVELNAQTMIDGFIILPGNTWLTTSTGVQIIVEDIFGVRSVCGLIVNYSKYSEVKCGVAGIKVIVLKKGVNKQLSLCGYAVLSSCDCSKTSFDT